MRYWFVRKTYGYGWTPATWEGWLSVAVFVVLLVLVIARVDQMESVQDLLIQVVAPELGLTALLLALAYKKGEKPRWQWGNKK